MQYELLQFDFAARLGIDPKAKHYNDEVWRGGEDCQQINRLNLSIAIKTFLNAVTIA